MKLTQKQENFCQLYVELGNASEAYRRSYNTKAGHEVVNVNACKLLANDNVSLRVSQIRDSHRERHNVTIDDLLAELEEARQLALSIESPAPAVSASMGKAKILGLDKQVIDLTNSDGSMSRKLTPEELRHQIKERGLPVDLLDEDDE